MKLKDLKNKMNRLKENDRVVIYSGSQKFIGTITSVWNVLLRVKLDNGSYTDAHIKQCRRLKPKRKRREFWINNSINDAYFLYYSKKIADECASADGRIECIHVREVIEKK